MGRGRGLFRLAILAVVAAFLAVSWGGLTTSRDAGMVFRDWPLSEGSVNPDGWLRDPDKRAEHGHRIFGAILGLLVTAIVVKAHLHGAPRAARLTALATWLAVAGQGALGGSRVLENSPQQALVHGCTGQAVFCLVVALAWTVAPRRGTAPREGGGDRRMLAAASVATVLVLYLQIVKGAVLRHNHGPVHEHLLGAIYVGGAVLWLSTVAFARFRADPAVARPSLLLALLLPVQALLGIATAGVLAGRERGAYTLAEVLLPTAHQTTGAVMLACAILVALAALARPRREAARAQEAFA